MNFRTLSMVLLPTLALASCAGSEPRLTSSELGEAKRPTHRSSMTLPPAWTPTAITEVEDPPLPTPSATSRPAPTATPPPDPMSTAPSHLEPSDWPLLVYCDVAGEAGLLSASGEMLGSPWPSCFERGMISPTTGLAVSQGSILRVHDGQVVRPVNGRAGGWSADGRALITVSTETGSDTADLYRYAADEDRYRLLATGTDVQSLGVSPGGTWVVYVEIGPAAGDDAVAGETMKVMAVSETGGGARELYSTSDPDAYFITRSFGGSRLMWLSDSTLLFQVSGGGCHRQLLHADLAAGTLTQVYGEHALAAADPVSQVVLLVPRGQCGFNVEGRGLVRLTAAGGWQPSEVPLPPRLGDEWRIRGLRWLSELGQFAVQTGSGVGDPPPGLITVAPGGQVRLQFDVNLSHWGSMAPSPDGRWIVVGGAPPHATRLYDPLGEPVAILGDGGALGYGPFEVEWLPDSRAFFAIGIEGAEIYRAALEGGWELELVEPLVAGQSELELVSRSAVPPSP